jgi:hypothetical protein
MDFLELNAPLPFHIIIILSTDVYPFQIVGSDFRLPVQFILFLSKTCNVFGLKVSSENLSPDAEHCLFTRVNNSAASQNLRFFFCQTLKSHHLSGYQRCKQKQRLGKAPSLPRPSIQIR